MKLVEALDIKNRVNEAMESIVDNLDFKDKLYVCYQGHYDDITFSIFQDSGYTKKVIQTKNNIEFHSELGLNSDLVDAKIAEILKAINEKDI